MRLMTRIMLLAAVVSSAGCASTSPRDPLEGYNRAMFGFNDTVDRVALKPAAEIYGTLPSFMQTGVYNFFGNLEDVSTAINNFLQGKLKAGFSDVGRIGLNTTLGVAGLFDVGTEAGLYKNREDFGQTLGKWGVQSGPYLVLPLLGPSTVRDAIALPLDFKADPWFHVRPVRWRMAGSGLRAVDQRATLIDAGNLIEDAALDRYLFVRDAYLQRRKYQVYDGDPPVFDSDEFGYDDARSGLEPSLSTPIQPAPNGSGGRPATTN
jgi:phospholipid-binding lipoprotein MlaA